MNKYIRGIIFDYGGTLDTNGVHWSEVLWSNYQELNLAVSKEDFREAYVYGERSMALNPLVKPEHTFYDVLFIKSRLQLTYLVEHRKLDETEYPLEEYVKKLAEKGYDKALSMVKKSRLVVERLRTKYKLVLVSNFYGNINKILEDFGLLCYFESIIESSVVGVRKPDPAIYALGVEAMGFPAEEIVVVGDSFSKDMVPAHTVGCKTVWLKGVGWGGEEIDESLPDAIISDLEELSTVIDQIQLL